MADNTYDFDALIASGTASVTDDGSGIDTIALSTYRTISDYAMTFPGNYAVRIFLTSTSWSEGLAYGEVMHTEPSLSYEHVAFTGVIENIYGAAGREGYWGNSSANYIQGDALDVAGGDDLINGLDGNDTLIGAGGSDHIYGDAGNDLLFGDTDPGAQDQGNIAMGDDALYGGAGNDSLSGGAGTNSLDGGDGYDCVSYLDNPDAFSVAYRLVLDLNSNTATVIGRDLFGMVDFTYATDHLFAIEHIVGTSSGDTMTASNSFALGDVAQVVLDGAGGNDTLSGGAGADALYGGDGNDVFDPYGNGNIDYVADLMVGGAGDDLYRVRGATTIVEDLGAGNDSVLADISYTLSYNIENLTLSTYANAGSATGNALANRLTGNAMANILTGGGGIDTLIGGDGNDLYIITDNSDLIVETPGQGTDTVRSTASFSLAAVANVENLVLTGTADLSGSGNALTNRITGNAGKNTLTSVGAGDTLVGGAGNDTFQITNTTTTVVEFAAQGTDRADISADYTLAGEVENLQVISAGGLHGTGNPLNNILIGGSGGDLLSGLSGNDTLSGGGGADSLSGGLGDDSFRLDAGDDSLNGGAGIDTVVYLGAIGLRIDLAIGTAQNAGLGRDTFVQIENLSGGSGTDILRGDAQGNVLSGGAGADSLFGAFGDDRLDGGDGDDSLRADAGNDSLYGGAGADELNFATGLAINVNLALNVAQNTGLGFDLISGIENVSGGTNADTLRGNSLGNVLHGNGGNDALFGNAGADWIYGGPGNDTISGGADGDVFVFGAADGTDVISDFQNGIDALVMGNFADVIIQASGANTILSYGSTHVTLLNVDNSQITVLDFLAV